MTNIPPGFSLITTENGVELYRKDYTNGSPDYVQVIDLSMGAKVLPMHGGIVSSGSNQGAYGGNNATFQRKTIRQFWNEFTQSTDLPFCLTNGQFFYMPKNPSPLPFPLKIDGQILTDGYARNEFQGKKLLLALWPDHADILELSQETLYSLNAPDIIAGLREDAEKAKTKSVGRTFVGVDDQDGDGSYELLMIFNTRSAKPGEAADVLRSFGSDKVMMLDGGGSTNLICQGNVLINTDRQIPQVIGVAAAPAVEFLAKIQVLQPYQVVSQLENIKLNLVVENRGTQTWQANQTYLKLESSGSIAIETFPIAKEVSPGERLTLEVPVMPRNNIGLHQISITVVRQNKQSPQEPKSTKVIVLPAALNDKTEQLHQQIASWENLPEDVLRDQITTWINDQVQVPENISAGIPVEIPVSQEKSKFDLIYSLIVPLCMLPVGILILLMILRKKQAEQVIWDEYEDSDLLV